LGTFLAGRADQVQPSLSMNFRTPRQRSLCPRGLPGPSRRDGGRPPAGRRLPRVRRVLGWPDTTSPACPRPWPRGTGACPRSSGNVRRSNRIRPHRLGQSASRSPATCHTAPAWSRSTAAQPHGGRGDLGQLADHFGDQPTRGSQPLVVARGTGRRRHPPRRRRRRPPLRRQRGRQPRWWPRVPRLLRGRTGRAGHGQLRMSRSARPHRDRQRLPM
jgi:hypothetical protein